MRDPANARRGCSRCCYLAGGRTPDWGTGGQSHRAAYEGTSRRWLELFQHGSMGSMEPPTGTARRSARRSGGVPAAFQHCRNGSGASCWNAAGTPGCSSGRSGSVPAPFRTSRGHRRSRWMRCRCATHIRSPLQLPWLDPHSLARWLIVLCHPGPDHRTIWSPP